MNRLAMVWTLYRMVCFKILMMVFFELLFGKLLRYHLHIMGMEMDARHIFS